VIDFGPALLFGFFYFIRGDLSFSKLRSLVSDRPVEDETTSRGEFIRQVQPDTSGD